MNKQARSVLPPWLWLWLLLNLPLTFTNVNVQRALVDLLTGSIVANAIATEVPIHFSFLYRVLDIVDLWPPLFLSLGLIAVLTPQLRARFLEKHYRLREPESDWLPLDLVSFIHHAAPNLHIKVNLTRYDNQAFIYPLGYSKATIALFAPFIILWETQRPTADTNPPPVIQ